MKIADCLNQYIIYIFYKAPTIIIVKILIAWFRCQVHITSTTTPSTTAVMVGTVRDSMADMEDTAGAMADTGADSVVSGADSLVDTAGTTGEHDIYNKG